jgi:hypothetical protein
VLGLNGQHVIVLFSAAIASLSALNNSTQTQNKESIMSKESEKMPSASKDALTTLQAEMRRAVPEGITKLLFVGEILRSDQPMTGFKKSIFYEENGELKGSEDLHSPGLAKSAVEIFMAEVERDTSVLNMAVFLDAGKVTIEFQYDRDVVEGEDDYDRSSKLIEKFFGHPWVYVPEDEEDLKPGFDKDGNPLPRVLDDDDEEWGESDWGPQPKN